MKTSTDRMLVTHVGSLPRSRELLKLIYDKVNDPHYDRAAYDSSMQQAVDEAMRQQAELGFDVINDGEQTKPSFVAYIGNRLGGFDTIERPEAIEPTRDTLAFPGAYQAIRKLTAIRRAEQPLRIKRPALRCTGPITYIGHDDLAADIRYTKEAFAKVRAEEAFMTAISPSNLELNYTNEYYRTGEEFLIALCDAMHVEYKAIVDAGLILQIDDPRMATHYDRTPGASIEECRRFIAVRVDALNHALRGIPEDRVRFHTCFSVNAAPRVHDMELKHYVDLMLAVKAGGYSIEAANSRHEHEWQLWETVKLPPGKVLIPGVISHSDCLVEHPELVAQRIVRYARVLGRENIIASADCGFGTSAALDEVHPEVAWAKLVSLCEGTRLATAQLWPK